MKAGWILTLAAAALLGCRSKPQQQVPPWGAFPPPGQPLPQPHLNQQLNVTVQGAVRNPLITWTPDLTLARALVQADYIGPRDPQSIVIFRGDKAILVETRQLLSGIKDPPLFPGDIVEVRQ